MNKAKIKLITTQDNQKYEFLCDGIIYKKNDATFIEFESDGERATIGVSDDLVTLNRIGIENSYTMILEKGKKHSVNVFHGINLGLSSYAEKILTKSRLINNINVFELYICYTLSTFNTDVNMKLRVKCEY